MDRTISYTNLAHTFVWAWKMSHEARDKTRAGLEVVSCYSFCHCWKSNPVLQFVIWSLYSENINMTRASLWSFNWYKLMIRIVYYSAACFVCVHRFPISLNWMTIDRNTNINTWKLRKGGSCLLCVVMNNTVSHYAWFHDWVKINKPPINLTHTSIININSKCIE
jgi:hypothetical protein